MMLDHCRYNPTIASYGRGTKLLPGTRWLTRTSKRMPNFNWQQPNPVGGGFVAVKPTHH